MKIKTCVLLIIILVFSTSNVIANEKSFKYTSEQLRLLRESKIIDTIQIMNVLSKLDVSNKMIDNKKEENKISRSSTQFGTYGDILISLIADSGSIGFAGHAGIVANNNWQTIESYAKDWSPIKKDGVQRYDNVWRRRGSLLYRPVGATTAQYRQAANFAERQIGKPYNWNFFNKRTTRAFYCSQLVWQSWLDAGIDIEVGSFPNAVISPADIANSSNTYLVERGR